jgi:hypothetical protein
MAVMIGIDLHQHVWSDGFRRALERRTEAPRLRGRRLELPRGGTFDLDAAGYAPERRLAELDRSGIERAVVAPAPTTEPTPDLVDAWHDDAPRMERASGGRLVPLAYAQARPGFPGAIVPAGVFDDLDAAAPLLGRLEAQGQLAFVHPTAVPPSGPAWRTSGIGYAHQVLLAYASWVAEGAARWPGLRVVFSLLGGGAAFQLERLVQRGLDPRRPFASNVWFETSSYGERALELTLQTFGAGRLVFGSDAPIAGVGDARAVLARFGEAVEREVLVANPLHLLSEEGRRWAA